MADDAFWAKAKERATRSRQQTAGERLFEFVSEKKHYACELRDHREFGTEAQFLLNGEFYIARTFRDEPSLRLTGRALAIVWAEAKRDILKTGGQGRRVMGQLRKRGKI